MDIVTRNELAVLIGAAKSDDEFDESEKNLIYKIAAQKNVTPEEVDVLFDQAQPIGSLGALSIDQKFSYLKNATDIVKADGKIEDSELIFCEGLAIKMGLKKNVISLFLEPQDEEVDILIEFRRYL